MGAERSLVRHGRVTAVLGMLALVAGCGAGAPPPVEGKTVVLPFPTAKHCPTTAELPTATVAPPADLAWVTTTGAHDTGLWVPEVHDTNGIAVAVHTDGSHSEFSATGAVRWTGPEIAMDTVAYTAAGDTFVAEMEWVGPSKGLSDANPDHERRLLAFSARTGKLRWTMPYDSWGPSSLVGFDSDSLVLLTDYAVPVECTYAHSVDPITGARHSTRALSGCVADDCGLVMRFGLSGPTAFAEVGDVSATKLVAWDTLTGRPA